MRFGRALVAAVLVLACAPAAAAAAASPRVPRSFFGVMADNSLLERSDSGLAAEFRLMQATRVGTVRIVIYWSEAQPFAAGTPVPSGFVPGRGGVPTNFAPTDRLMRLAAAHRMRVVPVVVGAPAWDRQDPNESASPPADPQPYADFLGTLVDRYGANGSFWKENPSLPYRPEHEWQIWNEPDLQLFWKSSQPWAPDYVRLLRAARTTLKQSDPKARVILGGLVNYSWKDLAEFYSAGGRGLFDVAAVHPFSFKVANVLKIVSYFRRAMAKGGDGRKRLLISELTWPSSYGKTGHRVAIETTERGQAARIREALPALAAKRRAYRLDGVVWSTWMTPDSGNTWWDYSGLRRYRGKGRPVNKPAMKAFRTALRKLTR